MFRAHAALVAGLQWIARYLYELGNFSRTPQPVAQVKSRQCARPNPDSDPHAALQVAPRVLSVA